MRNIIKNKLLSMADLKYLDFHSKLCKNVNLIGVRVPLLRKYAKELYRENINDIDNLLLNIDNEYYEEIMLKGLIIGLDKNISLDLFLERIKGFVPLIDNWAVCDTFCASLKYTNKYKKEIFSFLENYLNSDKEFDVRFALVMFLNYYVNDKYLDRIFKLISKIKINDYYVEMAISWLLSVCMINYFDKTVDYLNNSNISNFVYQKTIQKSLESFRVSNEHKDKLRLLREKNIL